jgi:hypothetical protein
MHQLPGCRSAAEAVRELPLRAGLKRCGVAGTLPHPVILSGAKDLNARRTEALREAGGWLAPRCFGWAGFQMLRFARMTK